MRVRMFCGALALGAALFCTTSVTPASAQAAGAVKPVVSAAAASAGGIYVYPGSFPCTPGPGFCRRIIIIILSNYSCAPNHDYSNGPIQMGVSESQGVAYLADINGLDIPASQIPQKGDISLPTVMTDPPPGGGIR